KLVSNLNNSYVHWEKFKDMQLPAETSHSDIWQQVVAEREQGFTRQIQIGAIRFKWWISNSLEAQLQKLDIGLAGGRGLDALLESRHTHRYKTNMLLDESIASAQLAGIAVSKKAAKEMLLKKRSPQNTSEQVCINIFRAMQLAFSKKDAPVSEEGFLQLHQALTKDTIKLKGIGQYRSNNKVDISGIDASAGYKPVDAQLVPELMTPVFDLYNNDADPFFI